MNRSKIASLGLAIPFCAALSAPAFAAVNIDYVSVGNAGNAADPATGGVYGAVGYEYRIARNETTVGQYVEFLNAKAKSDPYSLYSANMDNPSRPYSAAITRTGADGNYAYAVIAGAANKPISYVSWFDAARFCNWIQNGQGDGDTENGAYTLNGATTGRIEKNAEATIWIPTESEWYKAAYYDATKGGTGGYWAHATRSDTLSGNTIGVAASANFFDGDYVASGSGTQPTVIAVTDGGAYGLNSQSAYGTNDQAGNLFEITDSPFGATTLVGRGGSWLNSGASQQGATYRIDFDTNFQGASSGFRVASAVPEPAGMASLLIAGGLMLRRRKR